MPATDTGILIKERKEANTDTDMASADPYSLVVWNDDVNTFDWVIKSLIDICGHSPEQAEQCSLIVHFRGKCAVKQGELEEIKPMCEALLDRGISATIEQIVDA